MDDKLKEQIVSSIKCKYVHEDEMFIASNATLWPCCFLWSENVEFPNRTQERLKDYGNDWNNLKKYSIEEIRNHEWFKKTLQESWDPSHPKHFSRCIRDCGLNQANRNEITNII